MTMENGDERRRAIRLTRADTVHYSLGDEPGQISGSALMVNVSQSGFLLEMSRVPEVGSLVHIHLELPRWVLRKVGVDLGPGAETPPVILTSEVVRHDLQPRRRPRCGVKLRGSEDDPHRKALVTYLERLVAYLAKSSGDEGA